MSIPNATGDLEKFNDNDSERSTPDRLFCCGKARTKWLDCVLLNSYV